MCLPNYAGCNNVHGNLIRACCLGILAALSLLMAGCSSLPALSTPAASQRELVATQWLLLTTPVRQAEAICMLELNQNTLRLVATTPQGQTLLKATLNADGSLDSELSPLMASSGLPGEAIVSDLQIALWPAETLRDSGWQVRERENGRLREIRLRGKHWADIHFDGDPTRPQRIVIERGNGLYTVELRTLEWSEP